MPCNPHLVAFNHFCFEKQEGVRDRCSLKPIIFPLNHISVPPPQKKVDNLRCLTELCCYISVPMSPKKLLRFHCIWRHAALINDLIGIWDMIDQSLSHAQLSTDGRLISLKICSVLGRQREQTPLLGNSASAVVPSVTFHGRKINTNNGAVIKRTAESLSYENIPIIF